MCGFTFVCSKNKSVLNSAEFQAQLEESLKRRGPDAIGIYSRDNSVLIHYLLSLTGNFNQQPIVSGDIAVMFNGEIYNYMDLGCTTEIDAILQSLDDQGRPVPSEVAELDGEFAVVIVNYRLDEVYVYTDTFSTKPIYYGQDYDGLSWGLSSYPNPLRSVGLNSVKRLKPSRIYRFRSSFPSILGCAQYHHFSTDQNIDSFEMWTEDFERAVLKRCHSTHPIFVPLSSGYDSGCIAACMRKLNVNAHFYSINGEEDLVVLKERAKIHASKFMQMSIDLADMHRRVIRDYAGSLDYSEFISDYTCKLWEDPGAIGLSVIAAEASSKGERILMSGQGADETCSDYCINGKPLTHHSGLKGYFPNCLQSIFPWPNFYGGLNATYLSKDEFISGLHGVEGRYPFLDRRVVASYLRLTPRLKNIEYKSALSNYMKLNDYPYWPSVKRGFNALCGI
jgi:asparagine synthetase B (glutamine-hydrolysing)